MIRYLPVLRRTLPLFLLLPVLLLMAAVFPFSVKEGTLVLEKTIYGSIRPKSVVYSGNGLFFAQNMMYRHTITVYDRQFRLLKTLSDKVSLSDLGVGGYTGEQSGAPVEAAFSHGGRYAWVSQYHMEGPGFDNPGTDNCQTSRDYDNGFVYKIDTESLEIIAAVEVGCIPKFLAVSPDDRYLLVSNWCSGDLSVVDVEIGREIKRIPLGRYPRGIAIDSRSRRAYVAVMGSDQLAELDLNTLEITRRYAVGKRPRHLCLGPFDRLLYMSLNNEGTVAKMDLLTGDVTQSIATGSLPRSMVLSPMGGYLYVVNYGENTLSKVRTADMREVERVNTNPKPIGLTLDPETRRIWVACYSGSIMVFEDTGLDEQALSTYAWSDPLPHPPKEAAPLLPALAFLQEPRVDAGQAAAEFSPAQATVQAFSGQTATITDEFDSPDSEEFLPQQAAVSTESLASPGPKPEKAPVKASVSEPSSTAPPAAAQRYTLVLGSFSDSKNAEKRIADLSKKGVEATLLNSGDKYRVSYGAYATLDAAKSAMQAIQADPGLDAWVLKL